MIKKTLYFGNPCYLSTNLGQLVLNYPEAPEAKRTVPIEDVGLIILDHQQITISHGLFNNLSENNVVVIHCNEKHMPHALTLSMSNHHTYSEKFRHQIAASQPLRKNLWQQTVISKIRNQAALLREEDINIDKMIWLEKRVQSGDPENVEGRAAAYYWDQYFKIIDRNINRDRDGEAPNNLLNYGYAVLRAIIARALVGSGMHPAYGIHHKNKYNPYCLADDIMEPYRPFVDRLVMDICREEENLDVLSPALKLKLLKIPNIDVRIAGNISPLMVAVQRTSASLMKCFEGELKKIRYPQFE